MFRILNGAFLALTLFFAAGFLLASYRVALAGSEDGVCANEIHDKQDCPPDVYGVYTQGGAVKCELSSPWYGGGIGGIGESGPYYNCCLYEGTAQYCVVRNPAGWYYDFNYSGGDWYFRSRQVSDSRCDSNAHCVYQ